MIDTYVHMNGFVFWTNRGSTERGPPLCRNSQSFAVAKHSEITTKTTQQQGNLCSFMHSLAHLLMRVSSVLRSTPLRSFALPRSQTSIVLLLCSILLCLVAWYVANHSFCCSYCFCRSCVFGAVVRHPSWISVCLFVFFRFFSSPFFRRMRMASKWSRRFNFNFLFIIQLSLNL